MKKCLLLIALVMFGFSAQSQILISLILGDKLNSDKIEFGLDGGINLSTINGLDDAERFTGFNLGFYFDIKILKKHPSWMLNTGIIVKSPHGAQDLPVYSLNDANLDSSFAGGKILRKISYFNMPILMKYGFKNNFYAKAGVMLGLRYNAYDEFRNSIENDDDLTYINENRKAYHPIDAGALVGVGYRFMKGTGMNLGVQFYHGFVDITIDDSGSDQYNTGLYITAGIPIGKVKASEKKDE
jgi:hypothetical protein